MVSSILSKNEQNSLLWASSLHRIVSIIRFLGELGTPKLALEKVWPLVLFFDNFRSYIIPTNSIEIQNSIINRPIYSYTISFWKWPSSKDGHKNILCLSCFSIARCWLGPSQWQSSAYQMIPMVKHKLKFWYFLDELITKINK